jgi:Pyruvate/2-oxoacid:ferredoxin oxidoreductase gamma subunit
MYEILVFGCDEADAAQTSSILAESAFFEGKEVYSYWENMGKISETCVMLDNKPVSKVYSGQADCILLMNEKLLKSENIMSRVKKSGMVIVNSKKDSKELSGTIKLKNKLRSVNVSEILSSDDEVFPQGLVLPVLATLVQTTNQFSPKSIIKSIEKIDEQVDKDRVKKQFKSCIDVLK